jgi:hypothetical protein
VKYFILSIATDDVSPFNHEYYLKDHSLDEVSQRISNFANGIICTNRYHLCTYNMEYGFIREIDLRAYPLLQARDFAMIKEKGSFSSIIVSASSVSEANH